MTNVRKLLARLNPSVCRFDIGAGGWDHLTPQDVAAALGMVPSSLGRDLLVWCWWPDGSTVSGEALLDRVTTILLDEYSRRAEAKLVTSRALTAALTRADLKRVVPAELAAECRRLKRAAEAAKAEAWPDKPATLALVAKGALDELRRIDHCPACKGHGWIMSGKLKTVCTRCEGHGRDRPKDAGRAEAIGRSAAVYSRTWAPVWGWLAAFLRDEEADAARAMARALADDERCVVATTSAGHSG